MYLFLIILNQFQWWQLRHFILDPYRTTRNITGQFWKTYKDPAWDQYKLVERDFSGKFEFKNRENYLHKVLASWDFINEKEPRFQKDSTGIDIYRMVKEEEFSKTFSYRFNEITAKDHAWIEASISIRFRITPLSRNKNHHYWLCQWNINMESMLTMRSS